jgi:hypothetical protein
VCNEYNRTLTDVIANIDHRKSKQNPSVTNNDWIWEVIWEDSNGDETHEEQEETHEDEEDVHEEQEE